MGSSVNVHPDNLQQNEEDNNNSNNNTVEVACRNISNRRERKRELRNWEETLCLSFLAFVRSCPVTDWLAGKLLQHKKNITAFACYERTRTYVRTYEVRKWK